MIDEGIVMSPKISSTTSVRYTPGTGYALYEESMRVKCEAFRPKMYKRSELTEDNLVSLLTPPGEYHPSEEKKNNKKRSLKEDDDGGLRKLLPQRIEDDKQSLRDFVGQFIDSTVFS
ncbi:hypothetical protein Pcinc_020655 [Petrolisthes cinctipes]|uniref:Uncharacterized protein n=1 Tax=Petrolisthes cinctipes TaxID=88211 RepID=A0AAE1KIS5_PETCI|nr:hypothetical protein Pcinc_020655 [Petrolisthes cinctipes]